MEKTTQYLDGATLESAGAQGVFPPLVRMDRVNSPRDCSRHGLSVLWRAPGRSDQESYTRAAVTANGTAQVPKSRHTVACAERGDTPNPL